MPNHVTNRLTITGDEQSLSELFNACFRKQKREIPDFWYEKANDLNADTESRKEWSDRIAEKEAQEPYDVFDFELIIPVPAFISRGNLSFGSREEKTGRNWSKFNPERWGTKWNAYDMSIVEHTESKLVIKFDTAWNIPEPVIKELVTWFPELMFFHEFYDEGGWFFGDRTYQAGELAIDRYINGDDRKKHHELEKRLCIELKGWDPDSDEDCDEE
ncbi:TPA: hypothetical protein ACYSC8_000140 [Citrobacter freundii]|nr:MULTISPECIES: hypothetical protein [Citrobacter]MCT4734390.1 hypothetical protein [Citrobacter freundii]MDE9592065.1 hypothetical protein [Citrobacter freundii]MDE9714870.1 hypothetical protein [Citrobacter freundii]MDE9724948.1 hypothetical protein [Citrobacter freundii]MDE9734629.1 hypothetical protein [Citrobacter freundii]